MKKNVVTTLVLGASLICSGIVTEVNAGVIQNNLGGSSGFGENVMDRGDDGSTFIDLSSIFSQGLNFFGNNYSSLYLNINGNVTFASGLSTFTPFNLTGATNNPIIAPFFADIDTRGGTSTATPGGNSTGSNNIYWDLDSSGHGTFTATWDDVGYYSSNTSLLNAFQLQLIGQGNGDFDISITYEDINWTTGNASGGTNGLGGTVARGGWNSGNGTEFEEFDWSGNQDAALGLESTNGSYTLVRNGLIVDVPEPSTLAIFSAALLGLFGVRRKQK